MSETDGLTREFDSPGPVRLRIEAGSGDIRVDAIDTDRTVVRLRPARDGDDKALDLIARASIEQHGGEVDVDVPRSGIGFLRNSPDVHIVITVPTGSTLEVTARSADLHTTGQLEQVRVKSGSGDVRLDHVGAAQVQAGSGDTGLVHADGDVRVEAGSGDVALGAVAGGCWVTTGSGDVQLQRVDGALHVNTGSGDVQVDDASADVAINTASGDHRVARVRRGSVTINSASGDVEVGVVVGTPVWLDVASISGTVHSTLEGGHPPTDGEDAVALRVNTVSGDISLSHA